jgi:hypothetical protein
MHADARTVEKDIDIWVSEADKSEPKAVANLRITNIEQIIREAFGDNSKWKIWREYPYLH